MMKYLAIFLGCVAFVAAIDQVPFKLAPENLQNIKKAADECAVEISVDPAVFSKIADGTLPSDEKNNKYVFCTVEKLKFINEDGHIIVDKVVRPVGDHPLLEKFKEALRKCDETTKENPVATLIGIYRCYFESSPILFEF